MIEMSDETDKDFLKWLLKESGIDWASVIAGGDQESKKVVGDGTIRFKLPNVSDHSLPK